MDEDKVIEEVTGAVLALREHMQGLVTGAFLEKERELIDKIENILKLHLDKVESANQALYADIRIEIAQAEKRLSAKKQEPKRSIWNFFRKG